MRMPVDGAVLGYWGFDEANAGDPALDESTLAKPLVVTASPAVVAARVGNGRQFDGVNTVAAPATSGAYQGWLRGTIIVWIILDSVNTGGDLLRPIVCLDGPGGGAADQTAFGLFVDSTGRLAYRYTGMGGEDVWLYTAPSTIHINRYYSIALTQDFAPSPPEGNNGCVARLWLNNDRLLWASATVNGAPVGDPNAELVQQAGAGANTVLTVGGSQKTASKWHGVIDELSIHNVARAEQPYLRAAYFRLTLANTFNRLTGLGTVKTLGTAEMGGGTRWWCYERDQSIYVIRENSLGLFGQEILLITNSATIPGGAEKPRLAYDAATDTLLVAFISGGRVYRITANSEDVPSTLNMPLTQDTPTIIKALDAQSSFREVAGDGYAPPQDGVDDGVSNPSAVFIDAEEAPSFGIAIIGAHYGYAVYRVQGGAAVYLGQVTAYDTTRDGTSYRFFPITSRPRLARYRIVALTSPGARETRGAVEIIDALGTTDVLDPYQPNAWSLSRYGDMGHDAFRAANGVGLTSPDPTIITRTPVKIGALDTPSFYTGAGVEFEPRFVTRTPVKSSALDETTFYVGAGLTFTATAGGRSIA